MPTVPRIKITVDTQNLTYTFATEDPSVEPGREPMPIAYGTTVKLIAEGDNSDITVAAAVPSTATVTAPFDPALQPVTFTAVEYTLSAIGMVTLSVPVYDSQNLTGAPLVVTPTTALLLDGSQTPAVSFGTQVTLTTGLSYAITATAAPGLFIGQSGTSVPIGPDPDGATYTIADTYHGAYEISGDSQSKTTLIPLVGTINVSSTKKPPRT